MKISKQLKALMTVLLATVSLSAVAVDNLISIDQSGGSSSITIDQNGVGNKVRSLVPMGTNEAASIAGDSLTLSITQAGSNNLARLGIRSDESGGTSSSVIYSATGDDNTVDLDLNGMYAVNGTGTAISAATVATTIVGSGNYNALNITGARNTATLGVTGDNNIANILQQGDDNTATVSVTGNGNFTVVDQMGANLATATVTVLGTSNTVAVEQRDGTTGHTATINVDGSSNDIRTAQSGFTDTTINLNVVGNGNTYRITRQ